MNFKSDKDKLFNKINSTNDVLNNFKQAMQKADYLSQLVLNNNTFNNPNNKTNINSNTVYNNYYTFNCKGRNNVNLYMTNKSFNNNSTLTFGKGINTTSGNDSACFINKNSSVRNKTESNSNNTINSNYPNTNQKPNIRTNRIYFPINSSGNNSNITFAKGFSNTSHSSSKPSNLLSKNDNKITSSLNTSNYNSNYNSNLSSSKGKKRNSFTPLISVNVPISPSSSKTNKLRGKIKMEPKEIDDISISPKKIEKVEGSDEDSFDLEAIINDIENIKDSYKNDIEENNNDEELRRQNIYNQLEEEDGEIKNYETEIQKKQRLQSENKNLHNIQNKLKLQCQNLENELKKYNNELNPLFNLKQNPYQENLTKFALSIKQNFIENKSTNENLSEQILDDQVYSKDNTDETLEKSSNLSLLLNELQKLNKENSDLEIFTKEKETQLEQLDIKEKELKEISNKLQLEIQDLENKEKNILMIIDSEQKKREEKSYLIEKLTKTLNKLIQENNETIHNKQNDEEENHFNNLDTLRQQKKLLKEKEMELQNLKATLDEVISQKDALLEQNQSKYKDVKEIKEEHIQIQFDEIELNRKYKEALYINDKLKTKNSEKEQLAEKLKNSLVMLISLTDKSNSNTINTNKSDESSNRNKELISEEDFLLEEEKVDSDIKMYSDKKLQIENELLSLNQE